jgi:hypothetical protein
MDAPGQSAGIGLDRGPAPHWRAVRLGRDKLVRLLDQRGFALLSLREEPAA